MVGVVLMLLLMTACNFDVNLPTPTAQGIEEESIPNIDQSVTPTITLTPSQQPTREVAVLESATPTGSPLPPTATETVTPAPTPFQYTIQPGDTLTNILPEYGLDYRAIPAIEALNPGIPNVDNLPAGRVLLIPQPTGTFTPVGFEQTAVANATLGITPPQSIPANAPIECYSVKEGDNAIGIAQDYNITLEILRQLNPTIYFSPLCDFNNRSGGPECTVSLDIDQCVRVPFPTPTITLSPTPSGSETLTPTPTFGAPRVSSPPNNASITASVALMWTTVGILDADEAYFVRIYDANNPETLIAQGISRTNEFDLPPEAIPPSGEERLYEWNVAVAKRNEQGVYRIVGAESPRQRFILRG
jgi:LysM repeat protein